MLKVAHYAAQLEDYEKAIQIYEQVIHIAFRFSHMTHVHAHSRGFWSNLIQIAATSLDSSLLKYSAKEYFMRAALCHLSVDNLNCQQALAKYAQQYPAFQDSREYKLVKVR